GQRLVARHFATLAVVFLGPCLVKIANPALNLADDVNRLSVLDEALRVRVDAHRLDAGIGIKRISVAAEALAHCVLQEAMNDDDVAACEFLTAGHPVLHELAVVADELEVEALHVAAGAALAGCRQLDIAKPLAESEVG